MKVKFSRCNSNNLAQVPQVDGQMTYVKDAQEVYMDVGNTRNQLTDIITVADINNVVNPMTNKVYYDEATTKLYKPIIENNDTRWIILGGVDYIFEWDGESSTTNPDNLVLWQQIYEKQKEKEVIVLDDKLGSIILIKLNGMTNNQFHVLDSMITAAGNYNNSAGDGTSEFSIYCSHYTFGIQNNQITSISSGGRLTKAQAWYISPKYTYSTPFIPTQPGHPANKKYVDDNKTNIIIREWS